MVAGTKKVAAIQMVCTLGDVTANLQKADALVEAACEKGAEIVALPEFFTSGMAFHPSLIHAALPLKGKAFEFLTTKAKQHRILLGGSYLAIRHRSERYNTFVLAMPDGSYATHDKDLPTMWENCYYLPGHDNGVLDTPLGPIGAVLCWEAVRMQTARRLRGRVDLLIGGSCWWDVPEKGFYIPDRERISAMNHHILRQTPSTMGKLVGAPFLHAAHAGRFVGDTPLLPGVLYRSRLLGQTQIVDGSGKVVARMGADEGEGVITSQIKIERVKPSLDISDRFWIPELPPLLLLSWHVQNWHGKRYYRRVTSRFRQS